MAILVTGASGFVGSALIPLLIEKGYRVYGLSRHPPIGSRDLIPIIGDVTEPNLGLKDVPEGITTVYHLAGIHSLKQEDKDGSIWKTNVEGTKNVLEFCLKHDIKRLIFISTAYTWPVNPYGKSKIENESAITEFAKEHDIEVTILKPSIVMGTAEHHYPGHFSRFASAVIQTHRRAELVRRKIEGTLRLPVIEPLFRIKGNPEGKLNLIQIDQVVWGMANIEKAGTFWLTHPDPPTLQQLADWVGELIMVRMKFEPEFKPTPIEAAFQKMTAAFQPYLMGDAFKSNLQLSPPIDKAFIQETVKRTVLD
ncbi:MAG TPA: NAD(P)-dependent oxidoreductase [Dehalococcoidales bacterium]|nr:NAD(P)-dependent oxidoreductase [Dehalococcoidales bacterium]